MVREAGLCHLAKTLCISAQICIQELPSSKVARIYDNLTEVFCSFPHFQEKCQDVSLKYVMTISFQIHTYHLPISFDTL